MLMATRISRTPRPLTTPRKEEWSRNKRIDIGKWRRKKFCSQKLDHGR